MGGNRQEGGRGDQGRIPGNTPIYLHKRIMGGHKGKLCSNLRTADGTQNTISMEGNLEVGRERE